MTATGKPKPAPKGATGTIRLAALPSREPVEFTLAPDAGTRAALAEALGISAIRKLRFAGRLVPEGRDDWRLEATLGATVVQPCVVTLAPVTTRIDETVTRIYAAGVEPLAEGGETEMPEDDSVEPLPRSLDPAEVMAEALALALPDFPRAAGAELGEISVTPPGAAPIEERELRPFAGLEALRDRLSRKD